MYDEVPPDIEWSDPRNRMIWPTGAFTGTKAPGSGYVCGSDKKSA